MTIKLPTIDIKWKKYVLVKERITYFNDNYPNWSIKTERIENSDSQMELFRAIVTPDTDKPERYFVGYAQAKWWEWYINKTAALENAETSAIGRALAFMWIGITDWIQSAEEITKATASDKK